MHSESHASSRVFPFASATIAAGFIFPYSAKVFKMQMLSGAQPAEKPSSLSLLDLPNDVLQDIFDEFTADSPALLNLTYVCRDIAVFAHQRLYQKIWIKPYPIPKEQGSGYQLVCLFRSLLFNLGLREFVQTLGVGEAWNEHVSWPGTYEMFHSQDWKLQSLSTEDQMVLAACQLEPEDHPEEYYQTVGSHQVVVSKRNRHRSLQCAQKIVMAIALLLPRLRGLGIQMAGVRSEAVPAPVDLPLRVIETALNPLTGPRSSEILRLPRHYFAA
jgi:hypothetical protein